MRNPVFNLFCGINGTGKTTTIRKFLIPEINQRNLVIPANRSDDNWNETPEIDPEEILQQLDSDFLDLDDLLEYRSKKSQLARRQLRENLAYCFANIESSHKIYVEHDEIFDIVINHKFGFKNGGLVVDDFKNFIPAGNLKANVRRLFGDRYHRCLDIYMACHSLNEIPPAFLTFSPNIFLFKTGIDGLKSKSDSNFSDSAYDRLAAARERVNHEAANNPFHFEVIKF